MGQPGFGIVFLQIAAVVAADAGDKGRGGEFGRQQQRVDEDVIGMGGEAKGDPREGGGHQRHAGRGVGKMGVEVLDAGLTQTPGGKGGPMK